MADNVTIDPGTTPSVPIATDEGSDGKHYQKVKLFDPTADSVTGIGIAANPMHVQGAVLTGAATSAKQDTGNTSLASIDGKITACNTGAVVISSGTVTANAGTGTFTVSGLDRGTSDTITALNDAAALGTVQGCATASLQITGTWTATLEVQGTTEGATYSTIRIVDPATGVSATTITANGLWLIPVGGYTRIRVVATAYTSGTATVYIQAGMGSQATYVANSALAVTQSGTWTVTANDPSVASATLANVAGSASSVTLQASNASRKGLILFNDSTAALYIKFGATASATSFTYKVYPNGQWKMDAPIYTGIVDGIWDSATGNARVTEL